MNFQHRLKSELLSRICTYIDKENLELSKQVCKNVLFDTPPLYIFNKTRLICTAPGGEDLFKILYSIDTNSKEGISYKEIKNKLKQHRHTSVPKHYKYLLYLKPVKSLILDYFFDISENISFEDYFSFLIKNLPSMQFLYKRLITNEYDYVVSPNTLSQFLENTYGVHINSQKKVKEIIENAFTIKKDNLLSIVDFDNVEIDVESFFNEELNILYNQYFFNEVLCYDFFKRKI